MLTGTSTWTLRHSCQTSVGDTDLDSAVYITSALWCLWHVAAVEGAVDGCRHRYSAVKDAVLGTSMEVQQPVQVHVTSIVSMSLKSTVFGTCLYNTEIDFTMKNAVFGTCLYNTETSQ